MYEYIPIELLITSEMSYNQTMTQKIAGLATKPILNAAATYFGAMLMGINGSMDNRFLGSRDATQQLAILSGIGSVGTELVVRFVLPEAGSGVIYNSATMLLASLLQGGLLTIEAVESHPTKALNIGYNKILLLGAGSEVLSSYVNDAFIKPWWGL